LRTGWRTVEQKILVLDEIPARWPKSGFSDQASPEVTFLITEGLANKFPANQTA